MPRRIARERVPGCAVFIEPTIYSGCCLLSAHVIHIAPGPRRLGPEGAGTLPSKEGIVFAFVFDGGERTVTRAD
jgi:hypothetical protein